MKNVFFVFFILIGLSAIGQQADSIVFAGVSWSADGKSIYYASSPVPAAGKNTRPSFSIYKIDADGNNKILLIQNAGNPVCSPDGKYLAYLTPPPILKLFLYDLTTKETRQLTSWNQRDGGGASFSPDCKRICFASATGTGKQRNLWTISLDGTGLTRLTEDTSADYSPEWASAKTIYFYREKGDNKDQLCKYDLSKNSTVNISADTTHNVFPAWSKANKKLYYIRRINREYSIWALNPKSEKKDKILGDIPNPLYFRASPDGKTALVASGKGIPTKLFIVTLKDNTFKQLVIP